MEHTHVVVTLTSLLLGAGCTEGVTCPAWSFPAISVHVLATTTGSSLLGASGEVRDGAYRDSLAASGDGTYLAAYDRGGTYAVHIEREGYAAWDTTRVIVRETGGACSTVETVNFNARLVPTQ